MGGKAYLLFHGDERRYPDHNGRFSNSCLITGGIHWNGVNQEFYMKVSLFPWFETWVFRPSKSSLKMPLQS